MLTRLSSVTAGERLFIFIFFHIVQVAICFCFLKQSHYALWKSFLYILFLTKEKVLIKLFFKNKHSGFVGYLLQFHMLTPYLEKINLTLGIIQDCTVCLMERLFLKGTFFPWIFAFFLWITWLYLLLELKKNL